MDQIDWKIMHRLEADARVSFSELAEGVALSKSPCWSRVKAMEESGLIRGYRTELDASRLGFGLEAIVQVSINFDHAEAFEAAALKNPLIRRCHATTGEADYLLHILAADMAGLDRLLRQDICRMPGVTRSVTSMITREIKPDASLVQAARSIGR